MPNAHLLIVDDCEMMRRFLGRYFGRFYHVSACGNGPETLRYLAAGKPADIILMDLDMPGMSGLELIVKARAERPGIPIIMVTGSKENGKRIRCLEAGANDFITKPFHPSELNLRVLQLLGETGAANPPLAV